MQVVVIASFHQWALGTCLSSPSAILPAPCIKSCLSLPLHQILRRLPTTSNPQPFTLLSTAAQQHHHHRPPAASSAAAPSRAPRHSPSPAAAASAATPPPPPPPPASSRAGALAAAGWVQACWRGPCSPHPAGRRLQRRNATHNITFSGVQPQPHITHISAQHNPKTQPLATMPCCMQPWPKANLTPME